MTVEQQKDILDHTYKLLTEFNHGVPPKVGVLSYEFNLGTQKCRDSGKRRAMVGDQQGGNGNLAP